MNHRTQNTEHKIQITPARHASQGDAGGDHKSRINQYKALKMLRGPWSVVRDSRGFTFLELIIVLSIMAILTTIVIFNYQRFNANVTLENLAQDIAIRIVEAQKAAISGSTNINTVFGTGVAPRYGVYFKAGPVATPGEGGNEQFAYFFDIPNSPLGSGVGVYNSLAASTCTSGGTFATSGDECLSKTTITSGEYISKICYVGGGSTICSTGNMVSNPTNTLAITFVRPFPDATFMRSLPTYSYNPPCPGGACSSVEIEITSPRSLAQKTITVSKIGQISVRDGAAL